MIVEETAIETVISIVARVGIITAHTVDMIGGVHTVAAVAVLWSIEEVVAIGVSARRLKKKGETA